MDDGEPESNDGNNDQVPQDSVDGPHWLRRSKGGCGPEGPIASMAPVFIKLHVKCLIFSAKDRENAEGHLLCSNDWLNSQGIAKVAKCGRFCLTLGGDTNLWYEFITPVGNDLNSLQRPLCRQFSKLGQTLEELFQRWRSFSFMRQLLHLIHIFQGLNSVLKYKGTMRDKSWNLS